MYKTVKELVDLLNSQRTGAAWLEAEFSLYSGKDRIVRFIGPISLGAEINKGWYVRTVRYIGDERNCAFGMMFISEGPATLEEHPNSESKISLAVKVPADCRLELRYPEKIGF